MILILKRISLTMKTDLINLIMMITKSIEITKEKIEVMNIRRKEIKEILMNWVMDMMD
jgi:hypothetical protein